MTRKEILDLGDVVDLYCDKCCVDTSMELFGKVIGRDKNQNYYSFYCKHCEKFSFYLQQTVHEKINKGNN